MRIDSHGHLLERFYFEELTRLPDITLERAPSGLGMLRKHGHTFLPFRDEMLEPDASLKDMDRKHIDMRILSVATPNVYPFPLQRRVEICRQLNDALIAKCQQYPDRYRGLISLPLPDAETSVAELERVKDAEGIVGVIIGSNIEGLPLSAPVLEPVWEALDGWGKAVVEHPMHPVFAEAMDEFELPTRIGFMMDTTLAVTRMIYSGVFERYPNFSFVVPHNGGGLLEMLERLDTGYRVFPDCRKHITKLPSEFVKNFYLDTCSFFEPAVMMAKDYLGVDRLLFGTDYPYVERDTTYLERMALSAEDKEKIFCTNAARLFGIALPAAS